MTIEEMLYKLRINAHKDFNEILNNADFLNGDVVELSHRISLGKTVLSSTIMGSMSYGGTEIPLLLYHEKPISNFCDWYKNKGLDMFCDLDDQLGIYQTEVEKELMEVITRPEQYSDKVVSHAKYIYSLVVDVAQNVADNYYIETDMEDEWQR
ncbi:MAG: hypothetical protein R3Y47_12930 [Lachnospiraceae bacterium]